jgi:hypothetical protein
VVPPGHPAHHSQANWKTPIAAIGSEEGLER